MLAHLLKTDIPSVQSPEGQNLIRRAYAFAKKAHAHQKRQSGEPYFVHLEETAAIVASWHIDATTIAAALLHDTVEDTEVSEAQLRKEFGDEVAFLVSGVTKISHIKYRGNEAQVETLKKMVLALSEDIRVVFIKLADRTHNMRTLNHVPREKQVRISLETAEIYAPLAYRLGLGSVSGDLEDLAFRYLHPEDFKLVSKMIEEYQKTGEAYVADVRKKLSRALGAHAVPTISIDTRVKGVSSLYKKLRRYGMNIENIHDIVALRIIVEKVEQCYAALGVIHSMWPPLPGRIKDYIALPKPNGYRSLHTTVICEGGQPTEIQIRTEEMHYENEYGIAAYWAYSEGKKDATKRPTFAGARQLSWINQLKEWQEKREDHDEFLESLKIDFFRDRIFCITPRGEAVDLPVGATPVDFAYAIHSEVGDHCTGARVNGRMVQLDTVLESGDVVEIITQKNKRPNSAWLGFVKTRHARNRVRAEMRSNTPIPQPLQYVLTVSDRVGLLKDVLVVFSQMKINIVSHESVAPKAGGAVTVRILAGPEANAKADQLCLRLKAIEGVGRVEYKK